MPLYGEIIVIKRDGTDGTHFPLTANSCLFGRKKECDIRIQLPQVSKEHCKIEVNENKEVIFFNLSSVTPAQVNGNNITDPTYLKHGDVLTIIDRSFRFEYPPVSFPQKRRSRSQEKDTLQVLHLQQDLSQNSKTGTPQISDKELEQKNQTPNGNKKGQSQESVFTQNDASESAYKIHQSERKNEISFSSEFSVPVKYEDATKSTEENRELRSQDNSSRKDGNMSEDISQISNRRSANLRNTDTVTQKGVSHAGGTKNQDINSVVPHPDENSCRKPSRRSSATQSSTSLQNYVTKQKDHEDATPLKFQHTAENEPEKSKEIKGASNDYIFSASRPGTNFIPELCCIVSLDYTNETSHSQKSIDKIHEVGTAEIMPNLKDSFGSDGSFLSTPASNQKHFQENSSPFTGNTRKCFLKYSILPTELDSLNEMKYAETSFETEECSLDTSTGEHEKNDMSGNKYPKRRRSSKKMATEVIQTPKEQRNEMAVNCTLKDGNSGTIASSLHCSNSKSPRRSFKQNSSVNTGTMMKISTEELFVITTGSEMGRRTGQLSDDNFGRNYHEENAEKIKQPIPDVHEENTNMKNNMPVFSSLCESDVQTSVEAVSEMNMRHPCRSNKKPEIKKSPQKRKNTDPETLFQPLGKRKRVSFGGQLSPELFDKRLPPNSPLKKGAIPARLSLPFGNSPRAVLKKASGLRQSTIKGFSEREQGNNILNEKATSPPVRKSPAASGPSRRSPAASSPPAQRSPATASPPARKSPAGSPPTRRSPAASSAASPPARRSPATASPPARRAPARKSPVGSPPARRSPAASSAASPPARRSPDTASPPARKSPVGSPPARRSPAASSAASPPARRSPDTASPPARKSPVGSPPARRSPAASSAASPPARRSPTASPPARKSPAGSPPARRSPAASSAASPPARRSPTASPPARRAPARKSPVGSPPARRSPAASSAASPPARRSPDTASPPARKSPVGSPPARRSPAASSAASPPARRSPTASPPARRAPARKSPVGSPPARRSPAASSAASPPARRSPTASPPTRRSPAGSLRTRRSPATSPRACFSCNTPQRKGRFSISCVTCPSPKEQSSVAIQIDENKEITQLKTSEPTEQESKASGTVRRSKNFASRINSLHRRSAVGAIQSKRRSGASEANLIVAKSWADVVKQGVPKSQLRTTATKCGRKRSTAKKPTKPSKNHDSILKTPVRKFTGHFTTGHANSPAPIVVGKAHISTVNLAAQVPKVMYNYPLKQHSDLNESFTGMAEMFSTPPNREQEESLSYSDRKMSKQEAALEIHTETEAEESPTPSYIVSNQQQHYKEDAISSQDSTLGQDDLQITPRGTYGVFSETVRKDSIMEGVDHTAVTGMQDKTQEKNSETVKVLSGTKRLLKTPKPKPEPVEAMSGDKRILRTPKQKPEPMESFSGVTSLLRTPNQSQEPVQALPGVTRILRTPKQKPESVEALSGVRRFVKTPKQKPEPVESLSGVKRLLRTPKQKTGTVEVLSGIKRLLKTPRQKTEPVEALSGVKRLLRTPKQKIEPVEALSGMKELLRTPKENLAPVADEVCSKLMKSPEEMAKELMGSETERKVKQMQLGIDCLVEEPEKRVDIDCLVEEPEKRVSPMDDFKGIQRLFRTPKQKNKPLEDLAGLSRLLKTPKQRFLPVDDYLGLQKFMTEPKQNCLTPEIDYLGIKEMLETPDEQTELPELANSIAGGNESNINSKNGNESMGNESASKEAKLGRYVLIQRSDDKHDLKLEDTTGHAFSNPFNELKTEADREMIEEKCETSKVKQILSCYSEETNSQIGAKIDFVKEPIAELGQMDKEVVGVLASRRRTRRGKANESNFMKENAMQIQRYTRNSYKALSTNAIENCTDLGLMQESNNSASAVETVKKSLRGTSRKHFTATVESVISNNISHAPELLKPSKEPSDKMQPYLRRKRATKPKEPETILGLKEKADAKIPLRNKEDSKSDLKSQFAEENTQDKMQNENFGNLGMENNGNILKRSRRGRNITEQTDIEILNAAVEEDKTGRKKCTASKSYKKRLENNTGEVKENAVTHLLKGKKVHFLLEKNDALLLQEKSTLGENGDSRKESNASSTTEQTSRRSKRKISVAPQPVGFSPSKEKQALEINETQYKQDTFFSSENVIAGSDRSGVSFRLGHEECGEKGQNGESPDESQKVQLESVQTPAGRSRPRRQKVEKENIHQRGRGKQAICKEIPTQDSNKKADNMKKHTKKNQTKRGKGRKIDLQLEIPLPLEQNILERENPKVDNLNSAQSECSEQYIQNEPHPNDTQNITLGSAPVTAQCDSQKRDEVGKENALRRSKRKVLAHEITENVSQQDVGTVEQNMDIRNKNLPKRTKRRRIVSEFQTLLSQGVTAKEDLEVGKSSSAQEDCSLEQPQNAINPNETQNMPMESVQVLAEQSLPDGLNVPRKGRRKAIAQTTLTEYSSKQAGSTTEEDEVVKSACSSKENQCKRSRTRKIVPVSQALISPIQDNLPLQALTRSKNAEQSSETSETKTTANENRPHRSRRRKADDIITTGSVSASKKPRLPDKSNQEKMPRDIQDVSKESISKRSGRKQLVLQKTLAECNGQLGNNSEKAMPVKDESVPLKKGSGKAKKSKKNKGEQIALESQVSSSLNVSITVPPLSSEKGGTACKNPSTVIENGAVGKARQAKCSSRNKTVVSTTAVRRKYKQTAEEVDHENNLEKTDVANQKQCRSDRRKLVALEATICASVKEKYGLNTSSDTASNDLLEILDNNAAKKNPPRRGKRRQVNSDLETSASTSITTRDVILENKLKSKAEDSENTTLQKGKRKMKEEPTRAEETEGRTRGSKRTKK